MKILNFGSLNIDYVYAVDHFVRPGETISSTSMQAVCGGKGLNQSIALSRAGLKVYHAGSVGAEDGDMLLHNLSANGVDVSLVSRAACKSGHAIIQVDADGQNSILLYGGANQSMTEQSIAGVLAHFSAGDYLLLQNEINEIDSILRAAKARGMTIVLNPAPMNQAMLGAPLELVDILVLNEVEAADLCGSTDIDSLLPALHARFPKALLVLTLGAQGVRCQTPGGEIFSHGVYRVPVVDTTAAGDTFIGYFIAGLVGNQSIPECLRLASTAAALTVSRSGSADSIPPASEVAANTLELRA